jgi:hypothetical protein
MAGMYAVWHGPQGLQRIARRIHRLTCLLARALGVTGGFFDTIIAKVGAGGTAQLKQSAFNVRHIDAETVGISLDETTTREDVAALAKLLGKPLAIALEGHDRFMLVNRWRLDPSVPEHAVEAYVWPLLSLQTREVVQVELARYHYDALTAAGVDPTVRAQKLGELVDAFTAQLADALEHVPEGIGTGVV